MRLIDVEPTPKMNCPPAFTLANALAASCKLAIAGFTLCLSGIFALNAIVSTVAAQETSVLAERPIADAFELPVQRVPFTQGALSIPVE